MSNQTASPLTQYPVVVVSIFHYFFIPLLSCIIAGALIVLFVLIFAGSKDGAVIASFVGALAAHPLIFSAMHVIGWFIHTEDTLTIRDDGLFFTKRGLIPFEDIKDYDFNYLDAYFEFRCKQKFLRQTINTPKCNASTLPDTQLLTAIQKKLNNWLNSAPIKKKPIQGGFYGSWGENY